VGIAIFGYRRYVDDLTAPTEFHVRNTIGIDSIMSKMLFCGTALLTQSLLLLTVSAQGLGDKTATQRFAMMKQVIAAMDLQSKESNSEFDEPMKHAPILRFGDATRQASDGALWKDTLDSSHAGFRVPHGV
jgi:hypothetical protein